MNKYWVGTPNFNEGNNGRRYLFLHWTAGSFDGSVATLQNPAREASAHYVIEGDRVAQLVDEADTAWHCGVRSYNWQSIAYECVGWEGHPPTEATIRTVAELMAQASRDWFGGAELVLGENVMLHRMVYATDCPGTLDYNRCIALANEILDGRSTGEWDGFGEEIAGRDRYETAGKIAIKKGESSTWMRDTGDDYLDALSGMWVAGKLNACITWDYPEFYINDGKTGIAMSTDSRWQTNKATIDYWTKVKGMDAGDTCFVIPPDNFADGCAAAQASYNYGIPMILWRDDDETKELIGRFTYRIAIGGRVPDFEGMTERIAGEYRGETCVKIAERYARGWAEPMIVTGDAFPDALAATQWVGKDCLLFAEGDATVEALRRHAGEIRNIYWVGDKYSIPYERRHELARAAGKE